MRIYILQLTDAMLPKISSFKKTTEFVQVRHASEGNGELEKERKAREDAVRALDLERRGIADLKERLKRLEDSLAEESGESTVKLEVQEEKRIPPIRIEEKEPRTGNEPSNPHQHKRKQAPSVEIIAVEACSANLETPDTPDRGTSGPQSPSQEGSCSCRNSRADVHEEFLKTAERTSLSNGEGSSTKDLGSGSRPTKDPTAATVGVTRLQSPRLSLVSASAKALGKRRAVEEPDGHPLLKKRNIADLAARTKSQTTLSIPRLDLPSSPPRSGMTAWSSGRHSKPTSPPELVESEGIYLFGPSPDDGGYVPSRTPSPKPIERSSKVVVPNTSEHREFGLLPWLNFF
ncbi:hypothetical protein NMY22_g7974 [Coprinellus aureogranulatus]|nr:hypothetical protein NMY22_g7974 [Coprinellus aureogranulatus]